jgi:putative tryptophan/tyrosine transport system substrate-binding protein
MRRREFFGLVSGAAVAWPFAASAQKPSRPARVAILSTANPRATTFYQAFEQRLHNLGHVEGENITFVYSNAGGDVDRLPGIAAELIRQGVDVIVTSTDLATRAAKDATTQIPILMVAINYDPIALGFIDSIARPGANITGLFFQHLELLAKRFGLFKEMLPAVKRVAVFSDALTVEQFEQVVKSNQSVGFELEPIHLENPPYDFEGAFSAARRSNTEAIFVLESASIFRGRELIAQLAKEKRFPSSFAFREYVDAGGLMSYGVNFSTMYRRAAEYADKILRGAKPGDLPVEQSTKFDLVINLKTAKALRLVMPPALLATADEVIE